MIGWQMNDDDDEYTRTNFHALGEIQIHGLSVQATTGTVCLMWCVPCSQLQTDRHFKRVYCCLIRAFVLVAMGTWNHTKVSLLSKTLPNICGPRKCIIVSTRTLQCSCSEPLESTPDSVRLMLPSIVWVSQVVSSILVFQLKCCI
jgi:hypothetical protein